MPLSPEDIEFLKSKGIDPSQVQYADEDTSNQQSSPRAALNTLKAHAGSYLGGGAGALGIGALLAPWLAGPEVGLPADIAMLAGGVGGGLAGSYAGQKAQQAILPTEVESNLEEKAQEAQEQHPLVSGATDLAAGALTSGGSFSPTTPLKALMGNRESLKNVAIQAGVMPAINAGMDLAQGKRLDPTSLAEQSIGGALFAKPSLLGQLAGRPEMQQKPEPEAEPQGEEREPDDAQGKPSGPWMELDDKSIKDAFRKQNPKPSQPIDYANNPDYYKAKQQWEQMMKMPSDDMRLALHNKWVEAQKANPSLEPTQEPLKMIGENDTQKTPVQETINPPTITTTGETLPAEVKDKGEERNQGQEDVVNKATEVQQPFADQEGPNVAKESETSTSQSEGKVQEAVSNPEVQKQLQEQLRQSGAVSSENQVPSGWDKVTPEGEHHTRVYKTESTPVAVRDHIISGRDVTTGSVMQKMAESIGHPFQPLAKWLHENMDADSRKVPWDVSVVKDRSNYMPPQHFDRMLGDRVTMNALQLNHAPTVMEEAIHSMTSAKLPKEFNNVKGTKLLDKLQRYAKDRTNNPHLRELVNSYLESSIRMGHEETMFGQPDAFSKIDQIGYAGEPDNVKLFGAPYAMGDLHEFIAHAFMDKDFQDKLNSIQSTDGTKRTLWQRVVDAITHLLGIPVEQKSMLDRVLRSSAELVKQERSESNNALQKQSSSSILPHSSERTGEEGNKGKGVGRGDEGKETTSKDNTSNRQAVTTAKDFGWVGKFAGSTLDNLRAVPHKGAKLLADAFQKALDKKQLLTGKYKNASVEAGIGLSKYEHEVLNKAIEKFRVNKVEPKGLSPKLQKWFDTNKTLIHQFGQEHIDAKVPIQTQRGDLRLMKQDPNYWPTMANQQTEELFRQATDTVGMNKKQKEFEDYYNKKLGMSPEEAKEAFKDWKTTIQGGVDSQSISHQDYFNAIRRQQGNPLPPSFREQNPVRNMERYFDRASTALSHFTEVESNNKAMASLGAKKNAWGNPIEEDKEGSLAGNKYAKAALSQFHNVPKGIAEHTEEGTSSLATQLFIQHPGLQAHIVGSNFVKSALYAPNPYVAARAIGHAILHMREGWAHAKEGGLYKMTATNTRDMLDASLTAYQRMGGISKLVRDISTLGGMTTKGNAAYQQAYFEHMLPSIVNRASQGNKSAIKMLQHWDANYKVGQRYDKKGIQNLASIAASYVHGTGDIRQMPAWMMNEGEISGFMQLAHWSVAQTNNFMHDVVVPAKQGNLTPLLTGLFGAAVGGYIIKDLREKIQGKRGQLPSISEIANSDRGLEDNAGLLVYNAIAGMQYAGFGGLFSQVAKYPFDAAYKNQPSGATFPLDEVITDLAGTLHNISTTLANDPNPNYVDLAAAVGQHVLASNIKLASVAINQMINAGTIEGTPAEKKQLADKLGELRRFDEAEGLPYQETDEASNPYMNLEQKQFKREQDLPTAMKELPGLVSNIIQTYHDKPDVMLSKLKALKENQYQIMPSMENTPISFFKYLGYLQKEEGPEIANAALQDYLKHKMINEVKSSAIP